MRRYRRRRRARQAAELARFLAALDELACETRPWRPRRAAQLSLGAVR